MLVHRRCGGEYRVIGHHYVNQYDAIDVYQCQKCGQTTMKPNVEWSDEE